MSATRLLLIRHAESTWNASGRWQGQGDPGLSKRGLEQAAAAAAKLADEPLDRLISSDLQRAVQTAEIIGAPHGLKPQLDARLRELNVGSWTGLTRSQIERLDREALRRFEREDPDFGAGGGETRRQMRRRVRQAIEAVAAQHPGETVALVVHLGVIRTAMGGDEAEHTEIRRATPEQIIEAMRRRGRESAHRVGLGIPPG